MQNRLYNNRSFWGIYLKTQKSGGGVDRGIPTIGVTKNETKRIRGTRERGEAKNS